MTMENHPIDQVFKEKLGNFEQNPPAGLMDRIQEQIVFRSKVRRLNQVKAVIGIAAALVLILMAGWFTVSRQDQFAANKVTPPIQQPKPSVEPVTAVVAEVPANKAEQPVAKKQFAANASKNSLLVSSGRNATRQDKNSTPANNAVNSAAVPKTTAPSGEETSVASAKAQANQIAQAAKAAKEETKTAFSNSFSQKKKSDTRYFANEQFHPNAPSGNQTKGSWELKAELSPMFASQNQGGSSSAASGTKSANTVSGGMIASIKLSKRVSISSGIRFSQMRQDTHTDYYMNTTAGIIYLEPVEKNANIARDVSLYLPSVSSIVYSSGMQASTTTKIFASDVSQQFKYLEIPVQASYKLIDNKLSVGLTGGISTNILVGNLASVMENGIKLSQGNTDNLRNVIYSGSAGLEFGYDLGNRLVLTVEPRVKQYMHSVSSNDLVDFKPLQLGIFTGISYSFK